jgi:hypothetical protein
LQINFVAIAKGDAAKTIPLRLVLPLVAGGDFVDRTRFHRRERRLERELHFVA